MGDIEIFKKPSKGAPRVKKKNVLDEDTYVKELERIIQKDFFPDYEKLKVQNQYLEALENRDTQTLRDLYIKYSSGGSTRSSSSTTMSPATFDTPDSSSRINIEDPSMLQHTPSLKGSDLQSTIDKDAGLDKFLSQHTSEDNESFDQIMETANRQHKTKYPWLHEKEGDTNSKKILELPSLEQQAALPPKPANLDTWTYKNKNDLMYIPDGVSMTKAEKKEISKPVIKHENTRFFVAQTLQGAKETALHEARLTKERLKEGKIGVDGKELTKPATPEIRGFKFVRTPSPCPGVDASPLMTWGEIEGTPFRLDGGDTPLRSTPGPPLFRIADLPKREKLAHELAEKASQRHREEKVKAMRAAQSSLASPSPKNSMERMASMSPAAQRLVSNKLGVRINTDRALRASYTPSPSRRLNTPILKTPCRTPSKRSHSTPSQDLTGLTDDLLKLPKRSKPKPEDYF